MLLLREGDKSIMVVTGLVEPTIFDLISKLELTNFDLLSCTRSI